MNDALQIYQKIENPLTEATKEVVKDAVSSFTRCSKDAAPAVLLTCMAEGISLREYARTYHTIEGKSVMKAAAMLANFRTQLGGQHEILERTSLKASLKLILGGRDFTQTLTAQEAMLSRNPWKKWREAHEVLASLPPDMPFMERFGRLQPYMKDNWSTPSDWRRMLWWRVVSESVDAFCPEIDSGAWSIDELDGGFETQQAEPPKLPPVVKESAMDRILGKTDASAAPTTTILDASVVTNDAPKAEPELQPEPEPEPEIEVIIGEDEPTLDKSPANGLATGEDVERLAWLFDKAGVSESKRSAIYAKRGVDKPQNLTREQILEIIEKIEDKIEASSPS